MIPDFTDRQTEAQLCRGHMASKWVSGVAHTSPLGRSLNVWWLCPWPPPQEFLHVTVSSIKRPIMLATANWTRDWSWTQSQQSPEESCEKVAGQIDVNPPPQKNGRVMEAEGTSRHTKTLRERQGSAA